MNSEITSKQILKNIVTNKIYISVLLSIIFSVLLLVWINFKVIMPSFYDEMINNFVDEAKRVGTHISRYNKKTHHNHSLHEAVEELKKDFHIEKIKIFDKNGYIKYSIQKKDIGSKNKHDYFYNIVAKGNIFHIIAHKGTKTLEGRVVPKDVAEIYIPSMQDQKFIGAFEVYYDITNKRESLNKLITKVEKTFYIFTFLYVMVSFILLYLISRQNLRTKRIEVSMHQKAKMASMGEMLGNIAHQWRQPLSTISMSASAIKLQKDLGQINPELIDKSTVKIVETTKYLSNTIDDFRNFFRSQKEIKEINTKQLIDSSISIVSANLKSDNIHIILDIEDLKINTLENGLKQVLLNIINNAKDALVNTNEENRFLFIEVKKSQKLVKINIKDSAGGIPTDIIDKIFDPYFTTKHQSQGTGIGLYMSLEIIEKHLNGKISVFNENFAYKKQKYTGANFSIFIPINS